MTVAAPAAPPVARGRRVETGRRIGEKWFTPYLFILPHLLIFLLLIGIPFFANIVLSLTRYDLLRGGRFIGLQNYLNLFDPDSLYFERFWTGLWNTVLFVLMSTPLLVGIGLFLAVLLNGKYRGRNFFRAVYFAPWTLGIAVVGLLWWWILNSEFGLLTLVLRSFGIGSPAWLTTNPWAWFSILLATLWWTIGFNVIILLAGMQSIAVDLYEAASIDGANKWQQFVHVTLPSLRPVLLLVITLQIISSFNLVGQPQLMTGGGPGNETRPVLLFIYETGFTIGGRFELGAAAAMALVVAAIMLIVSVINFRFFSSERA